LGGFVAVTLVLSHYLYRSVPDTFGDPSTAAVATPLYTLAFDPDRVRVFWSLLGGAALAAGALIIFLAVVGLIAGFTMYHTFPQYRGHELQAARSGLNLALGIENGYIYVDNASMEQVREAKGHLGRFGGPGRLVVRLGHAVVLEKDGRPSRVVGSGLTFLQAYERVSMIVPLYGRGENFTVEEIETKDSAVIEQVELLVFHRADPGPKEHQVHDGPMVYNRYVILNRIWDPTASDWSGVIRSVSKSAARDLIGRHKLEDIIPMSDKRREQFKQALKDNINQVTRGLGVEVSVVDIGRIKLPDATRQQMLDRWTAEWESRAKLVRAQTLNTIEMAEAKSRVQAIIAMAQGLHNALRDKPTPKDIITLRYIEYLEHRVAGLPVPDDQQEVDTLMQLQALGTLNEL
jgi:regulator of protease activity HflC (stomatin/prohibitin superfamily)